MKPRSCLRLSGSAWDSPTLILSADLPRGCVASQVLGRRLRFHVRSAMLLILICFGYGKLFAQQSIVPAQGWPQNDPYSGRYAPQYAPQPLPNQQPAYPQQQPYGQQPGYAPPERYDQQQTGPQQPYPDPGQQYPQQDYGQTPAQALNTEQLEQLVAPIALYPDTLVAQVLAAATYPAQVVDADHWRQAQGYVSPDQIAAGANMQSWDPSLKALTAFPQVLAEMDQNLRWTIALGNAYYNQPQDVLDVVQVMRQRAQAAGNLASTPQESVNYDQGYIQVAPVNPQLVYLPAYDPWTAYGQPIQPYRGFSLVGALGSFFNSSFGSSFGSGAVRFGLGIAISAFSHTSFGWLGWGLDWLTHSLLFHNSNYYSHSTTVADWGLPRGGPRAGMQRGAMASRLPNNDYRLQNRGQFRPQTQNNFPRPGLDSRAYGGYNGNNRSPAQGLVHPSDRYANNRPYQGAIHNYPSPGAGYARPPMEAYNRIPPQVGRPQQYTRPSSGYGSGFYNSPGGGYAVRPSPAYSSSQQAYRTASPGFQRGGLGERTSGAFAGKGFEGYSGKPAKSGGFHSFGDGRGHEPKAPKPYKESSHGHSDRGGHSGGLFGGKHHR